MQYLRKHLVESKSTQTFSALRVYIGVFAGWEVKSGSLAKFGLCLLGNLYVMVCL